MRCLFLLVFAGFQPDYLVNFCLILRRSAVLQVFISAKLRAFMLFVSVVFLFRFVRVSRIGGQVTLAKWKNRRCFPLFLLIFVSLKR